MVLPPILLDAEPAIALLRDGDGNIRAALICWSVVLSAFVILRIPREVLLGCLIVASATVGLAATVVDMAPEKAVAGQHASEIVAARGQTSTLVRGPSVNPPERKRPY